MNYEVLFSGAVGAMSMAAITFASAKLKTVTENASFKTATQASIASLQAAINNDVTGRRAFVKVLENQEAIVVKMDTVTETVDKIDSRVAKLEETINRRPCMVQGGHCNA